MSLLKDISELVNANVISQESADKIQDYYKVKKGQSHNRLFIVFGILGAILIGLGIILIIAHNWDNFNRITKLILAFLPLVVSQLLCGFVLIKKDNNTAWIESVSATLFFTIGASISLVSQIYNINGDLTSFLLIWMILSLPIMYLMKSSVVSLLYIIGITYYAVEAGYSWSLAPETYIYWALLLGAIPYYYLLFKQNPIGNFITFHNWLLPLSVIIALGTVSKSNDDIMFVAYISLFGFLYLIGNLTFFKKQASRNNGYIILGLLGTIGLLLVLSFNWFWEELRTKDFMINNPLQSPEFFVSIALILLASTLLFLRIKSKGIKQISIIDVVFLIFAIIFITGLYSSYSVVLVNLLVFVIGIIMIKDGAKMNHLGIMNLGLIIITVLIACRFFDTDLSFVIRGLLFVIVGSGFFATNYWLLNKRKSNEQ